MRWVALLLGVAAAGAVLWFGWPTPYITYQVGNELLRVNRLTGKREVADEAGWKALPSPMARISAELTANRQVDRTATKGRRSK